MQLYLWQIILRKLINLRQTKLASVCISLNIDTIGLHVGDHGSPIWESLGRTDGRDDGSLHSSVTTRYIWVAVPSVSLVHVLSFTRDTQPTRVVEVQHV